MPPEPVAELPAGQVLVAPFSNSHIRDWPVPHYAALVGLLLERLPEELAIRVVGTANQRLRGAGVVRAWPAPRVLNECGRLGWEEVVRRLGAARLVIGNNSSIAHVAGRLGVPTVCVFGGSHQRHEWAPRGANVVVVSRAIGCSPCQLDHGGVSPYDKACLRLIEPATVADAALMAMARAERREAA